MRDIFQVGNKTAMSLARRLKKLINLDLSWCRNLTEEDFGLIVDGCLSLRVLKAFGCTQVCILCQTPLLDRELMQYIFNIMIRIMCILETVIMIFLKTSI